MATLSDYTAPQRGNAARTDSWKPWTLGPGSSQLSTRSHHPSMRSAEPSMRSAEPSMRSAEPSMRSDQPSMRSAEPSMRSAEPSMRCRKPSMRSHKPSSRSDQPSTCSVLLRPVPISLRSIPTSLRCENPWPSNSELQLLTQELQLWVWDFQPWVNRNLARSTRIFSLQARITLRSNRNPINRASLSDFPSEVSLAHCTMDSLPVVARLPSC